MDSMVIDTASFAAERETWISQNDRHRLLNTLSRAREWSAALGHEVIASFVAPIPWIDLVHVYAAAERMCAGDLWFWEQPARSAGAVGIGGAAKRELGSGASVAAASTQWQALLDGVVVSRHASDTGTVPGGPLCFAGFAFDSHASPSPIWRNFPSGALLVPELLFGVNERRASLTLNAVIAAEDDVEHVAAALLGRLHTLRATLDDEARTESTGRRPTALREIPAAKDWKGRVAEMADAIRQGTYDKVVLARSVEVVAEQPFDVPAALDRLRGQFPSAYVFAVRRGGSTFLGATPERLARVALGRVRTMALAGSAPRGTTPEHDNAAGNELLASGKNAREHQLVIDTIRAGLAPLVTDLDVDASPRLVRLPNVQHLRTQIAGELRPNTSVLDVVAALHPTPAVGGVPRQAAVEAIRAREEVSRGWYAGALGWIDASGDGEFAVGLRSALVSGTRATLFAGCGIVGDSDPESEYAESALKLQVMLRGLGIEDAR